MRVAGVWQTPGGEAPLPAGTVRTADPTEPAGPRSGPPSHRRRARRRRVRRGAGAAPRPGPVRGWPVLGAQGLAAAQLLQHVVHAGHGQPRVQGLAGLAVGVQVLGQLADAVLFRPVRGRKRKGLEAAGLVVARVVADPKSAARRQGPESTWTRLDRTPKDAGVRQRRWRSAAVSGRSRCRENRKVNGAWRSRRWRYSAAEPGERPAQVRTGLAEAATSCPVALAAGSGPAPASPAPGPIG